MKLGSKNSTQDAFGLVLYRKANDLIEARHSATLNEQKVILFCMSRIDLAATELKTINIYLNDFRKFLGSNLVNDEIMDILRGLRSSEIEMVINDGKDHRIYTGWFQEVEAMNDKEGNRYVRILFSDRLKPWLLELNRCYKDFRFDLIAGMNSIYSIRLYELMKKCENMVVVKYSVETLRTMFCLEGKYEKFGDFRRYVLDEPIKEINEKTDLNVKYEKLNGKGGRTVTDIVFTIHSESRKKQQLQIAQEAQGLRSRMNLRDTDKWTTAMLSDLFDIAKEKSEDIMDPVDYMIKAYEHMNRYDDRTKAVVSRYSWFRDYLTHDHVNLLGLRPSGRGGRWSDALHVRPAASADKQSKHSLYDQLVLNDGNFGQNLDDEES